MDRRTFLILMAGLGGAAMASPLLDAVARATSIFPGIETALKARRKTTAQIAFVKTSDRITGVNKAIDLLMNANGSVTFKGKSLFLKPNFNSADPTPGSTHNDTLSTLVKRLQQMGTSKITVGDRSGMGVTRTVMSQKGIFRMADELGFEAIVLDALGNDQWQTVKPQDSHWRRGFALPHPVLQADGIVQTCCLKTHRYGGHFTLSLKNSVGLAAKQVPGDSYNYMTELHGSANQRRMIAEINTAYQPDMIVLDGVEALVNGGPDKGKQVHSQVILAGTDRIAMDAVGVALLRYFGTTPEVSQGKIFDQAQIARAVELGLGIDGPEQIELVTDDPDTAAYAAEIQKILQLG